MDERTQMIQTAKQPFMSLFRWDVARTLGRPVRAEGGGCLSVLNVSQIFRKSITHRSSGTKTPMIMKSYVSLARVRMGSMLRLRRCRIGVEMEGGEDAAEDKPARDGVQASIPALAEVWNASTRRTGGCPRADAPLFLVARPPAILLHRHAENTHDEDKAAAGRVRGH